MNKRVQACSSATSRVFTLLSAKKLADNTRIHSLSSEDLYFYGFSFVLGLEAMLQNGILPEQNAEYDATYYLAFREGLPCWDNLPLSDKEKVAKYVADFLLIFGYEYKGSLFSLEENSVFCVSFDLQRT